MTELLSDTLVKITGQLLIFCLVFGMAATVDTRCFNAQIKNAKAIMTGVLLQFLLMVRKSIRSAFSETEIFYFF